MDASPTKSLTCDACQITPRPWSMGRAAILYKGIGRALVMGLKHGDRTDIAPAAAQWMSRAAGNVLQEGALLVPIPLHRKRLLHRRYNQAALLANALARLTGLAIHRC